MRWIVAVSSRLSTAMSFSAFKVEIRSFVHQNKVLFGIRNPRRAMSRCYCYVTLPITYTMYEYVVYCRLVISRLMYTSIVFKGGRKRREGGFFLLQASS